MDVRFNALRNALYHTGRRLAFERWNRFFSFLIVLLGAAAISDLGASAGIDPSWTGAVVATVGALQLVFDFSGQASAHKGLQRDYYGLLADIEETLDPDAAQLAKWQGTLMRIAGDEPPMLRARDAKAYNDALDALDRHDGKERLVIPFHHRLLGGFLTFEGHNYRKVRELAA